MNGPGPTPHISATARAWQPIFDTSPSTNRRRITKEEQ